MATTPSIIPADSVYIGFDPVPGLVTVIIQTVIPLIAPFA